MITRSNLAEQLREYQIRSKHDWASVSFFSSTSSNITTSRIRVTRKQASGDSKKGVGFFANAMKQKNSFIQLFAMTGILLLSMRSLGQKYRIHGLEEDIHDLRAEHGSLLDRIKNIKRGLLLEASQEPTGLFASRLQHLFSEQH